MEKFPLFQTIYKIFTFHLAIPLENGGSSGSVSENNLKNPLPFGVLFSYNESQSMPKDTARRTEQETSL